MQYSNKEAKFKRWSAGSLATMMSISAIFLITSPPANSAPSAREGGTCGVLGTTVKVGAATLLCDNLTGSNRWTRVLKTTPIATTSPDWVRWDASRCAFVPGQRPAGGRYSAQLRKVPPTLALALATQGEGNATTDAFNASWRSVAGASGAQIIYGNYDNLNSGTTKVQEVARTITTRRPAAVTSWNVVATAMPAMMQVYNDACVPVTQVSVAAPGATLLAADNAIVGRAEGNALVAHLKKVKKTAAPVTAVALTIPSLGQDVNQRSTVCTDTIKKAIPAANTVTVEMENQPQSLTKLGDWLTANPQAGTVVVCNVSDVSALGAMNALKSKGKVGSGFVAGFAGSTDAINVLRSKDPVFVATVDPGFGRFGDILVPMMLDAISGRSVPAIVRPQMRVYTADNIR
jgi:DNA-binding LacI/PurR family transcriptional regulator